MAEIIERLRGHHEPQEELIFHEILKHVPRRAAMLELGGFWSYYSLWFLHEAPECRRSIVVEPDPHNLGVGKINAEINNRPIEFLQASVGANSLDRAPFQSETGGMISVPQVSVPDILFNRSMDRLDILHCDTQGAETDVIRSCEALMRERRIRFVIVSTHAYQISGDPLTHQRCLSMLQDFGGRILAEHDVHESFSGDGLIAAYFGLEPIDWSAPKLSYNRYSSSLFPNPLVDLDEMQATIRSLESTIQSLQSLQSAAERDLNLAYKDASDAKRECAELRAAIATILSSKPWWVTAPRRAFSRILRR